MIQTEAEKSLFDLQSVLQDVHDQRSEEQIDSETKFILDLCSRNMSNFNVPETHSSTEKPKPSPSIFRRFNNARSNSWCTYSDSLQDLSDYQVASDNTSRNNKTNSNTFEIPSDLAVITIHGAFFDSSEWLKLEESVGRSVCRWVNFTLPGFDGHDAIRGQYSGGTVDVCDMIRDLLDHLQIHRVIFLGHSFGGFVRNYFTMLYPERVAAIGSIATHSLNWNIALRSWHECLVRPGLLLEISEEESAALFADPQNQKELFMKTNQAFTYMRDSLKVPISYILQVEKLVSLMIYMRSKQHRVQPIETYREINPNIPSFVVFGKDDHLIQQEKTTETQYFYINKSKRHSQKLQKTKEVHEILKGVNFDYDANVFFENFIFAFEACKHTPHIYRSRETAEPLRAFIRLISHLNSTNQLSHLINHPRL